MLIDLNSHLWLVVSVVGSTALASYNDKARKKMTVILSSSLILQMRKEAKGGK